MYLQILLSLARTYWKQAAIAVALLCLFGSQQYYKAVATKLKATNADLVSHAAVLQREIHGLSGELDKQSAAVQELKDIADAKAAASKEAIAKAAADAVVAKRDAAGLMKRQPARGENSCEAARALFESEVAK